jgi:uncharacterized protein YdeI (YjbR/CyaY-like superfamily)
MKPTYFRTAAEFRAWLKEHHATETELWMGAYKKGSGRPGITWAEAVDEALCWGWVDSVRRGVDDQRYMNRFTPRRPGSNWSEVNIRRVEELTRQGRMRAAGRRAFEDRQPKAAGAVTYERRHEIELPPDLERRFRRNNEAWTWFRDQSPSYRSMALYWLMSAKRPETRERRLDTLIEDSASGLRIAPLRRTRRR